MFANMLRRGGTALMLACLTGVQAQTGAPPAAAPAAAAKPVVTIAVYSQLARDASVTQFQPTTGSNITANRIHRFAVPEGALDKAVVMLAGQAIRKAAPTLNPWLIAPTDTDLFSSMQQVRAGSPVEVPADLLQAMREQGAAQILVFTRYRADAVLRAVDTRQGEGQLEGVGFYVDHVTPTKRNDTGELGTGFLAPYTYFRASLVDAQTQQVLRTRTSTASYVVAASRAQASTHPWDALTSTEKMQAISKMLGEEIGRIIPEMMAPR